MPFLGKKKQNKMKTFLRILFSIFFLSCIVVIIANAAGWIENRQAEPLFFMCFFASLITGVCVVFKEN